MSRWIDADKVLKELHLNHKDVIYIDKNECAKRIEKIPSIEAVPMEYHDKVCEAMARKHQAEIAELTADRPQKVIAQVTFDEEKLREIVKEAVERVKEEYEIVDRPQGEWIFDPEILCSDIGVYSAGYRCSICGKDYFKVDGIRFCPSCGAMMKGADDE